MSDVAITEEDTNIVPQKKGRKGLLVGLVLAALLGGGGFFAAYSGMLELGGDTNVESETTPVVASLPSVSFVELQPLVISLGSAGSLRHLRFRASLEVVPEYEEDVEVLIPRVMDVLNSYLRAVDIALIENPKELLKLRGQMIRRIQIVVGEGRVRDLLILEFVLN